MTRTFDEQSEFERAKYVKAYAEEKYRRNAGRQAYKNRDIIEGLVREHLVEDAVDFGCGNGDLAVMLDEVGVYTHLIDFMGPEYLSGPVRRLIHEGRAQFHHSSLWDPDLPVINADLAVCTDVMEHIPEDRVPAVLDHIRARAPVAFFRISMSPDSPRQIERRGGALHVTVKPQDWWTSRILERYTEIPYYDIWTNTRNPQKRVLVLTAIV